MIRDLHSIIHHDTRLVEGQHNLRGIICHMQAVDFSTSSPSSLSLNPTPFHRLVSLGSEKSGLGAEFTGGDLSKIPRMKIYGMDGDLGLPTRSWAEGESRTLCCIDGGGAR